MPIYFLKFHIKSLNKTIETLDETIERLKKTNEEQAKKILRLKSKNDKDSSNSSKPSSTNGYKKVITNRREKSNKNQGAQKFHKPHSLNNKLNQFINSGNVVEETINVNMNDTYKKNDVNVLEAPKASFNKQPIIV